MCYCIPCEQKAAIYHDKYEENRNLAQSRANELNIKVALVKTVNGLWSTRAQNEDGYERLEKIEYFFPEAKL